MSEKTALIIRILCFVALAVLAALCSSCKQIEYVTVEKVRTVEKVDTFRTKEVVFDSISVMDSTYVEKYDSLWREYRQRIETRFTVIHDTTENIKEVHDTARVEVPVRVEVEKPLTAGQKFYLAVGPWCFWILVVIVLLVLARVAWRIYTRR